MYVVLQCVYIGFLGIAYCVNVQTLWILISIEVNYIKQTFIKINLLCCFTIFIIDIIALFIGLAEFTCFMSANWKLMTQTNVFTGQSRRIKFLCYYLSFRIHYVKWILQTIFIFGVFMQSYWLSVLFFLLLI